MEGLKRPAAWSLLGITRVDLYVPILKYVFGEEQMEGPCALVSLHRQRQEFYGLDRDDALLSQRVVKESVHELGQTTRSSPPPRLPLRSVRDLSAEDGNKKWLATVTPSARKIGSAVHGTSSQISKRMLGHPLFPFFVMISPL